jgi:hypothetical protein
MFPLQNKLVVATGCVGMISTKATESYWDTQGTTWLMVIVAKVRDVSVGHRRKNNSIIYRQVDRKL